MFPTPTPPRVSPLVCSVDLECHSYFFTWLFPVVLLHSAQRSFLRRSPSRLFSWATLLFLLNPHSHTPNETLVILFYFFFLKKIFFWMWIIFKVFIEFFTILLLFYVVVFCLGGMWDLQLLNKELKVHPLHWKSVLITGWPRKSYVILYFNSYYFLHLTVRALMAKTLIQPLYS